MCISINSFIAKGENNRLLQTAEIQIRRLIMTLLIDFFPIESLLKKTITHTHTHTKKNKQTKTNKKKKKKKKKKKADDKRCLNLGTKRVQEFKI